VPNRSPRRPGAGLPERTRHDRGNGFDRVSPDRNRGRAHAGGRAGILGPLEPQSPGLSEETGSLGTSCGQTLLGTTNGARYSRVSIASASESLTNDSVDGLI
jgi:hypothetical protein